MPICLDVPVSLKGIEKEGASPLKEKLEDQGQKKVELDRSLIEKKLELMVALQGKLATVGKLDDKLDNQIKTLAEQVAVWRANDESTNKPSAKAKRSTALNVMRQS